MEKDVSSSLSSSSSSSSRGGGGERRGRIIIFFSRILQNHLILVMMAPYLIGILWTSLHPIISVVTGELKCRGLYIDENALDVSFYSVAPYSIPRKRVISGKDYGLCDAIEDMSSSSSIRQLSCIRHGTLEVARVVPLSNAVEPVTESLVLIMPHTNHHHHKGDHSSFIQPIPALLERLADPDQCTWLAKTILVVSSRDQNQSVDSIVSQFMHVFLEKPVSSASRDLQQQQQRYDDNINMKGGPSLLPLSWRVSMIRTVLVLNIMEESSLSSTTTTSTRCRTGLRILPQGTRGVLPNLDLVFAAVSVFRHSNVARHTTLSVHPFPEAASRANEWIHQTLPARYQNYARGLVGMALFARSLVRGPHPPHAPILNAGIDSLTLDGCLSFQHLSSEYPQKLEHLLRALSNLHERLHHSSTQYLLPSPITFVSHNEYLIPNILILLPLAIRALSLVFFPLCRIRHYFHMSLVLWVVLLTIASSVAIGVAKHIIIMLTSSISSSSSDDDPTGGGEREEWVTRAMTAVVAMVYTVFFFATTFSSSPLDNSSSSSSSSSSGKPAKESTSDHKKAAAIQVDRIQSLHFISCLAAIYLHVPLALAHVSLSYPSSLLWTFLLAFPSYGKRGKTICWKALSMGWILLLWPPVLLVALLFSGEYTTYIICVFTPLHLLLSAIVQYELR